ncbi:MAG TPA: hypothetical protein DCE23_07815 [Firmicutes bacterium]|nr:hypothetical protein [Bacillota bacterium]
MKKGLKLIILGILAIFLTGCGNKYKGYWCNYNETASIVVLLEDNIKSSERTKIEEKIETFDNVASSNYYSKEDYNIEIGDASSDLDIYASYFILLNSMDSVGTYVEELKQLPGVKSANQTNAKTNVSLYNIKSWGKYTYTDSDESTENDLETGKFKIKKGVITFTPDKEGQTKLLYIKDGLLCGDADCNKIFAKSTSTCTSPQTDE